jgi:hypothetical protein
MQKADDEKSESELLNEQTIEKD